MKVLICLLTLGRADYTVRVLQQNMMNAEADADLAWVDNGSNDEEIATISLEVHKHRAVFVKFNSFNNGIAGGWNQAMHYAEQNGYDAIVIFANDILLPQGWLKQMIKHVEAIPNTGMAGIHCVEHLPQAETINGLQVYPIYTAFGDCMIPMSAIKQVGYFNTDFDPYSMQDADYAVRLNAKGFVNYYIGGLKSEHIGHDVGKNDAYRAMKDKSLSTGLDKFNKWKGAYHKSENFYVPFDQMINYIIDMEQYFGE